MAELVDATDSKSVACIGVSVRVGPEVPLIYVKMPPFADIFKVLVLGVIEGLTEFIPVSSTGHLLLFSWYADFNAVANNLLEIVIQFAAILAVCFVYRKKLLSVICQIKQKSNQQFVLNLVISFVPAAFMGLLFHDFIKAVLFSPLVIAISLIIGGVIIIAVDSRKRECEVDKVDDISSKQALIMGLYQVIAMIPGVSRSGATIIGGLLCGLNRKTATEFSFFMSIIVISAATFFDLYKNFEHINFEGIYLITIGFVVAFMSSILVIKWLINYVSKNNFVPFAIYRIILGSVILSIIL